MKKNYALTLLAVVAVTAAGCASTPEVDTEAVAWACVEAMTERDEVMVGGVYPNTDTLTVRVYEGGEAAGVDGEVPDLGGDKYVATPGRVHCEVALDGDAPKATEVYITEKRWERVH